MRIYLKVITRSSQQKVEKVSEGNYKIWIHSVPEKGKANQEIINILANYFGVSKNKINIIGGKTSSKKIIDIIPSPTNYYSPKS
jgi:hypothetical protein